MTAGAAAGSAKGSSGAAFGENTGVISYDDASKLEHRWDSQFVDAF